MTSVYTREGPGNGPGRTITMIKTATGIIAAAAAAVAMAGCGGGTSAKPAPHGNGHQARPRCHGHGHGQPLAVCVTRTRPSRRREEPYLGRHHLDGVHRRIGRRADPEPAGELRLRDRRYAGAVPGRGRADPGPGQGRDSRGHAAGVPATGWRLHIQPVRSDQDGCLHPPGPGLKVRLSKRGARWAIGPRWLRLHVGAGGTGISTGAGPVTYYRPLRRRRGRR